MEMKPADVVDSEEIFEERIVKQGAAVNPINVCRTMRWIRDATITGTNHIVSS